VTDFEWLVETLLQLSICTNVGHGEMIARQLLDVMMRVRAVRERALGSMVGGGIKRRGDADGSGRLSDSPAHKSVQMCSFRPAAPAAWLDQLGPTARRRGREGVGGWR